MLNFAHGVKLLNIDVDQKIIGADQDDSHVVELLAILVGNNVSSSAEENISIFYSQYFFRAFHLLVSAPRTTPSFQITAQMVVPVFVTF